MGKRKSRAAKAIDRNCFKGRKKKDHHAATPQRGTRS